MLFEWLWLSGSDPLGLLDPGRMLDLEASLRRDQRRFDEALARLDEAEAVGRSPERVLIQKGFTLEVMGDGRGQSVGPGAGKGFQLQGSPPGGTGALRLFREAAEREEATAELGRRVLGYLFRARHDEGLRIDAGGPG